MPATETAPGATPHLPLAVPDAVTGLVGRAAFRQALTAALAAQHQPAVVGLRVRGVAGLNRREGEESGDDLLRVVAAAVRTIAGDAAVGRIAATTLAAVVRLDQASSVVERITHALDGRVGRPSITLVSVPVDPEAPADALVAVEDALDGAP
jgi:GGDEF domain-containing protein